MHVAGVVAEYNPFHLGHGHHLRETRAALESGGAVLAVMSGNFVQRGECAALSKWARAEMALRGGADLVLELPLPWAVSSAERFARGAVEILAATGVVDTLSFGCEGRLEDLSAAADCLLTEGYRTALRRELTLGIPFAAARQRAASALIGSAADCLSAPNNNLGVEYLKALRALRAPLMPLAVPRLCVGHDAQKSEGGFASASAIRLLMAEGDWLDADAYLPEGSREVVAREAALGRAPARLEECGRAVLARLRGMGESGFAALPDAGAPEGLPHRMVDAAWQGCSIEEVCALAKTKRYAHARIRRLVLWSFLGLTTADLPAAPLYLKVLGMNGRGKALLKEMGRRAALPIVTKPAHGRRLTGEARRLFELEARATDLYALCSPVPLPCGGEWTQGPVVLE